MGRITVFFLSEKLARFGVSLLDLGFLADLHLIVINLSISAHKIEY